MNGIASKDMFMFILTLILIVSIITYFHNKIPRTRVKLTKGWHTYRTFFDENKNGEPFIVFNNNQRKYLYEEDCVYTPLNWKINHRKY